MKRATRLVALPLLFFLLSSQVALGQQSASRKVDSKIIYAQPIKLFEEFVQKQMVLDRTIGLSVGFMKDDFVWANGYGFADLENKVPAKSESAYRLASVTKPMTAIAIMQLVEKGKINLDAEVQTYVAEFPKKQWPVTVRQLLGHLGGISHYKNAAQELHIKEHKSTREAIAIFENFDLVAEPGTRYSYTSYGYNLLGAIIEAASGMSYGDYMKQHVWQPLGMNDTRVDSPSEIIPNRVRGYQLANGKVLNSEFVDISSRFAAGGTRSTVKDLLKFAEGIINKRLLSEASLNQMVASMSTREGLLTDYGMGWDTRPQNGRYAIAHSGGQQETRTFLFILPTRRLAIAVASNSEHTNPWLYAERLFQFITGELPDMRAYTGDNAKRAFLSAIEATFNYGHSYFDREQKPLSVDEDQLAEAFAHFNTYVTPEAIKSGPENLRKIREGQHPISGEAFTKIGSYMTAKLRDKHGPERLTNYPALGAPAFFHDYIALSKVDGAIPKQFRFSEEFELIAAEIASDWKRSNTEYVRRLVLSSDTNLDLVGKQLRESFRGSTVYPNLVDNFFSLVRQLVSTGNRVQALKASLIAVDLYPEAPAISLAHGVALILNKDLVKAEAAFRKSASINPNGPASASGLNNVAYQLAGSGMIEEGISVLRLAIQIYPKEANLYDSVGEMHLRKGEKATALEFYKKALDINPEFGNAANAREIVKRLSSELGGK